LGLKERNNKGGRYSTYLIGLFGVEMPIVAKTD
jgi:hypothetical protein